MTNAPDTPYDDIPWDLSEEPPYDPYEDAPLPADRGAGGSFSQGSVAVAPATRRAAIAGGTALWGKYGDKAQDLLTKR